MLSKLKKLFSADELLSGNFGIEREGLRVTQNGVIAMTSHPLIFEPKITHPYITTDFAESQIELVTPSFTTLEKTHTFLVGLYDLLMDEIEDELLWPQSMPANIETPEQIQTAVYSDNEDGKKAQQYREFLIQKYGPHRQLISGIHYNFSFNDEMLLSLYKESGKTTDYSEFKNQIYLKIVRNYTRYRWLLVYLLGCSPVLHETYAHECVLKAKEIREKSYSSLSHVSYRNSLCGYQNKEQITVNYNSVTAYVDSLEEKIKEGYLESPKEFYSPIRLKPKNPKDVLSSLSEDGIMYLELRSMDINPFESSGIALQDLYFIHLFILYCLTKEESDYPYWQIEADENAKMVACQGLNKNLMLFNDGTASSVAEWGAVILGEMLKMDEELGLNQLAILNEKQKMITGEIQIPAQKLISLIETSDYLTVHLQLAKTYKKDSYNRRFGLIGYEDLELSTQILIRESLKRGINVDILDRKENFIALKKGNRVEYIKQATKTSLDCYSTVLVMENKLVTKLVLESHGIKVPTGYTFESANIAKANSDKFLNKAVVVKPKSTNFGLGITIFKEGTTQEDLNLAIDLAFSHDSTILIEEFVKGKEYRFLVINDEVVGILHRIPANIVGDGIHTISELVDIKNRSSLRGKGYVKPLEKIMIDESATLFLKAQGLTKDSVIANSQTIYLRENSNISTGGDSLDFTDEIPLYYKEIAIAASKAVGAAICGVDMMIENVNDLKSNHAIIELNFNPAIHIHCFPYKGQQRNVAEKILKALGFIK